MAVVVVLEEKGRQHFQAAVVVVVLEVRFIIKHRHHFLTEANQLL